MIKMMKIEIIISEQQVDLFHALTHKGTIANGKKRILLGNQ